jgi:thioredoxin 1
VKQITHSEFDAAVLRSREPVLVDFFTDGCGPCRMMAPILQEIETEANGALQVVKIDAATEPALAASYRVQAVPAFLAFVNGRCVGQTQGTKSKTSMKKWFADSLRSGA